MPSPDYEPLASEWGKLFPMMLEIKVDGPLKRRIEDLTNEVSREYPDLPPIIWGIVLFSGFMMLRACTRSEGSTLAGLQRLLSESLAAANSGL